MFAVLLSEPLTLTEPAPAVTEVITESSASIRSGITIARVVCRHTETAEIVPSDTGTLIGAIGKIGRCAAITACGCGTVKDSVIAVKRYDVSFTGIDTANRVVRATNRQFRLAGLG